MRALSPLFIASVFTLGAAIYPVAGHEWFGISTCSFDPAMQWVGSLDHVFGFFVLTLLSLFAFKGSILHSLLYVTTVGILIEFAQVFCPSRFCNLSDFLINFFGWAIALGLAFPVLKINPQLAKK